MSVKQKSEADRWWHELARELQVQKEQSGKFTRIVLTSGIVKGNLQISAEIWNTHPDFGAYREHMYTRPYPHGDHNYLSGACWLAAIQVWKIHDAAEESKRRAD